MDGQGLPAPKAELWSKQEPKRGPKQPTYAVGFRCIGERCEDMCCGDWDIPVDRRTYESYKGFRSERLVQIVAQSVVVEAPDGPDGLFARIRRGPTGRCPFQEADQMCAIQKEYGAEYLSATCSIYPRALSWVGGRLEGSLSLSCPEAARNVLLRSEFMEVEGDLFSAGFRTDNTFRLACDESGFITKPGEAYVRIRGLILDMVGDRSRPMVERLLAIGEVCRRMEVAIKTGRRRQLEIARGHVQAAFQMASRYEEADAASALRLRLELFRELGEARRKEGVGPRFAEVLEAFFECSAACVGHAESHAAFVAAETEYCRPFFDRHPHVLENFVANYIFQNLFPYGRSGSADFASLSLLEEWVLMTTQFAWIYALMVGVAWRYGSAFGDEHVVQTIQSYAREIEHYPAVLRSIRECVERNGLDRWQGMAMLLGASRSGSGQDADDERLGSEIELWDVNHEIERVLNALRAATVPDGIAQRMLHGCRGAGGRWC